MDTNIDNYEIQDLKTIIELPYDFTEQEKIIQYIIIKTNKLSETFKFNNPELSTFFNNVQMKLIEHYQNCRLDYISSSSDDEEGENKQVGNAEYEEEEEEEEKLDYYTNSLKEGYENIEPKSRDIVNKWYDNQYLNQDNQVQNDKITRRANKLQVFNNNQFPVKREQLGVNDNYVIPVKQDSLNPNLKNSITRFVNLDSQFRQYTNGYESISTNYTLDLSDTLKDVLKLRLYSFQIPHSWYVIDRFYGNTCFWIIHKSYSIPIYVNSGNYSHVEFVAELIASFTSAGFTFDTTPVLFNRNSGIITMNLYNGTFNGTIDEKPVTFIIDTDTTILFFDFTATLRCNNNCFTKSNHYLNNTLGWLMGFRMPYVSVLENGNSAPAVIDLNGTKYLILAIDDYNQNHVNNNVVSVSRFDNKLRVPNYFSEDLPQTCIPAQQGSNVQQLINQATIKSIADVQSANPINGLLIGGKYQENYQDIPQLLPSAPRVLTQSQIYTINEIKKNRINNINFLSQSPTTGDIFAILPVKTSAAVPTGSLLVEYSGSLQENVRVYFGPVDIDRMSVKLLDDKGNILNLNGHDWCFTMIAECLYQY